MSLSNQAILNDFLNNTTVRREEYFMESWIKRTRQRIRESVPGSIYCACVNAMNFVQGRRHRVLPFENGVLSISDGDDTIYISQRKRHPRYKKGITKWVNSLAAQYQLNRISLAPGGVFIDCGANVGELGIWARRNGLEYHAFEPESKEARCCDLNNYRGEARTNRMGLWFEDTELKFYSKAHSADSSFIEISQYDSIKTVKVATLDQYVQQKNIKAIEVLKIEAEGAEPEVLRGAEKTLRRCHFVTIDCGCERGIKGENTIRDACNSVYERGFRMIDTMVSNERVILMFENMSQVASKAA
ncbi:MAG: FkbM family methyltransferase [Planctomycetota bacterium]|nr:MAG: FkbM family methyltransferase [Planctomycetota bacterium]